MRLVLHRYIFLDLLKAFVLSTAALTLFLSMAYALGELRKRGLGPIDSAHLILYFVPAMLVFAMPVAALLTTTLVYGRLAADNEITACRAVGISMAALLKPVILLGVLIGVFTFALYDRVIPWARYQAEKVGTQNLERIFFHRMRTRRSVSFGDLFISAKHIQDNILYGVVLRDQWRSGQTFVAYAPAAEIRFYPPEAEPPEPVEPLEDLPEAAEPAPGGRLRDEELARQCWDAEVTRQGRVFIQLFRVYIFDEGGLTRSDLVRGNPSVLRTLDRPRAKEPQELSLGQLAGRYKRPEETFLYRRTAQHVKDPDKLRDIIRRIKARSLAEMHSRYASVASCVLLVALGAALGTLFRHGHILTAFFISMGPALFAIFSILFGVKMVKADPEHMHGLVGVIWMGNLVVLVLDAVLISRLVRGHLGR